MSLSPWENKQAFFFSTFGVTQYKWMFAAKATVTTMISSFGGGFVGLASCYLFYKVNVFILHYEQK